MTQNVSNKVKYKKGDNVIIITGSDRGKQGVIMQVNPKTNKVVVQGVNIKKRHTKPSRDNAGGIVAAEAEIDLSNIAIVDPSTAKASKVGFKITGNEKVRIARKSGEKIS